MVLSISTLPSVGLGRLGHVTTREQRYGLRFSVLLHVLFQYKFHLFQIPSMDVIILW